MALWEPGRVISANVRSQLAASPLHLRSPSAAARRAALVVVTMRPALTTAATTTTTTTAAVASRHHPRAPVRSRAFTLVCTSSSSSTTARYPSHSAPTNTAVVSHHRGDEVTMTLATRPDTPRKIRPRVDARRRAIQRPPASLAQRGV